MNVSAEQLREREKPFYSYLEERKKLLLSFASRIHNIKSYFLFLATNDEISMVYANMVMVPSSFNRKIGKSSKGFHHSSMENMFLGKFHLEEDGKKSLLQHTKL